MSPNLAVSLIASLLSGPLSQCSAQVANAPQSFYKTHPQFRSGQVRGGFQQAQAIGRFSSPDLHSVMILWPNPDGTVTKRKFDLHNTIFPELSAEMAGNSGLFHYRYVLENGKQSKDPLKDFSVVVYQDSQIQTGSDLWRGGLFSPTMLKERIGIPGAPPGLLVAWMCCLQEQPVSPGGKTSFTITSEAKPGFTSAATEYFPHLNLTDEWPDEILDQLEPVLDLKWIQYRFITLGPRYGPDDPDAGIAADYLTGIQELIRIHRLESSSPFVKEAIADLDAIASGSSAGSRSRKSRAQSWNLKFSAGWSCRCALPIARQSKENEMRKLFTTIFLTIALYSSVWAQTTAGSAHLGVSAVPFWPANGDTSQLPKGQYVFYDPPAGEYVVSCVPGPTGGQTAYPITMRFGTHSLVAPDVTSAVTANSDGTLHYSYTVANGKYARQPIQELTLSVFDDATPKGTHANWTTSAKAQTCTALEPPPRARQRLSGKLARNPVRSPREAPFRVLGSIQPHGRASSRW